MGNKEIKIGDFVRDRITNEVLVVLDKCPNGLLKVGDVRNIRTFYSPDSVDETTNSENERFVKELNANGYMWIGEDIVKVKPIDESTITSTQPQDYVISSTNPNYDYFYSTSIKVNDNSKQDAIVNAIANLEETIRILKAQLK